MCGGQFRCENFWLHHPSPVVFLEPQIGGASTAYIIYRMLVAVYFSYIVILVMASTLSTGNTIMFVSFSFWALVVLALDVDLQALVVLNHYSNVNGRVAASIQNGVTPQLKVVHKVIWVLQNLSLSPAIIVTVVFWLFIYPHVSPLNTASLWLPLSIHGANSVYVVFDTMVTAIPVRILHFYQPFLMGAIYAAFTGIYWLVTNSRICQFLDYTNSPGEAAMWLCALTASGLAVHFLMFGLYRLRLFVYSGCSGELEQTTAHDVDVVSLV